MVRGSKRPIRRLLRPGRGRCRSGIGYLLDIGRREECLSAVRLACPPVRVGFVDDLDDVPCGEGQVVWFLRSRLVPVPSGKSGLTAPFSLYAHCARACTAFGAVGTGRGAGAGEGTVAARAGGAVVLGYWLLKVLGSLERKAEASEWDM
jgi:hypothetical protein